MLNVARSRARAERRSAPHGDVEDVLDPARFRSAEDRWPHHWAIGPAPWPTPEQELLKGELLTVLVQAMAALPAAQREVVVLRDVEGWPAEEACNALGLSDTNQRVLLHRGRTRLRKALEDYFGATEAT